MNLSTLFTGRKLSEYRVIAITKDNKGNLWFAAYGGGVSRYDGTNWQSFTTKDGLTNNDVWAIAVDSKGNLWFGTYGGGASRYES